MAKYRKRPVIIEAERWDGTSESSAKIYNWVSPRTGISVRNLDNDKSIIIETLEGDHRADIGDFIIQGVKGEFYPCKPDIFEMTYEEVDIA